MSAEVEEPKRPQNAYWIWLGENRDAMAREAGTKMPGPIAKLAGERWKKLSEAQRAPFDKKAAENRAEYEKAMEEFKARGGQPGKRSKVASAKRQKADKKARREEKKKAGCPKRPQNSYWIWLSEHREAVTKEAGSGRASAVGKLAGEKWKALTEAQKAPYESKAAELKAAYTKALAEWKQSGGGANDGEARGDQSEESEDEAASEASGVA